MQLSFLTLSMMGSVVARRMNADSIIRLCKENGFGAIDLLELELSIYGRTRLKAALQKYDVRIESLITMIPMLTANEQAIRKSIAKSIAIANELHSKRIMVIPGNGKYKRLSAMPWEEKLARYARNFSIVVEQGEAAGIGIMFEDTPAIQFSLSTADECEALLDRVPGLQLVFDTGNMLPGGDDPITFYERLKSRIAHIHLKDQRYVNKGLADRTIDGRKMAACVWGEGIIPLADIQKRLWKDGYQGTVSMEYTAPKGSPRYLDHDAQIKRFLSYWNAPAETPAGALAMRKGKVFHWAFIGAGSVAKNTAKAIIPTSKHRIETVYTRTFEHADTFADKFGAQACTSLVEAVQNERVEGVYVASTADSHFEIARQCLVIGKPVLLEKPFTINRQQAEELFALAEEKALYLAEAMWSWYSPVAQQMKQWLDEGKIGNVKQVTLTYSMPVHRFFPRLTDPVRAGGRSAGLWGLPPDLLLPLVWGAGKRAVRGRAKGRSRHERNHNAHLCRRP
jgi:sugar phosphate isomerase/epimerase